MFVTLVFPYQLYAIQRPPFYAITISSNLIERTQLLQFVREAYFDFEFDLLTVQFGLISKCQRRKVSIF